MFHLSDKIATGLNNLLISLFSSFISVQLSRYAAGNPASGDPEDDTGLEADSQFFAPLALSELSFLFSSLSALFPLLGFPSNRP